MSGATACPSCGVVSSGKFCADCGSSMSGAGCAACGARLKPGALYCSECGVAVGARARKPATASLPWILSAAALAAFSIVIAVLVQRQSVTRTGDMTLTGGLPGQESGGSAGMPSMEELAAMSPREAADRLFERAMTEHAGDDYERFSFFADMGLQAYAAVPPREVDADLNFHVGMLRLLLGDSVGARTSAEEILSIDEAHLLGLLLASRTADFAGDPAQGDRLRGRIREIVEANGGIPDLPEYTAHRPLLEPALEEDPS